MSCIEHGCEEAVELLCKKYLEIQLFCKNNCHTHSIKSVCQFTKALEMDESDLINKVLLEMKIGSKISKAVQSYQRYKSEFHETLQKQILTINNTQIDDYALHAFLSKLAEERIIKKGFYIPEDKIWQIKMREKEFDLSIEKLNKELDEKKFELEALNSSINLKIDKYKEKENELSLALQEVSKKLENKANEVENLNNLMTEKEKEIHNLNFKIQEKDIQIKFKDQQTKNYNSSIGGLEYTIQDIEKVQLILNKIKNQMIGGKKIEETEETGEKDEIEDSEDSEDSEDYKYRKYSKYSNYSKYSDKKKREYIDEMEIREEEEDKKEFERYAREKIEREEKRMKEIEEREERARIEKQGKN